MAGPPLDPSSAMIDPPAEPRSRRAARKAPRPRPPAAPAPRRRPRVLARPGPLRRRLIRLYDALHHRFGAQGWWRGRTAFEIVAGVILARGTDRVNVDRALARGRAGGLRRAGSEPLRALVRHVARHYQGRLRRFLRQPVSTVRRELLSIPGIRDATADAILLYAAGRPVFVADAAVRLTLARHRMVAPT